MKKYAKLVQCDSRGQIVIPKEVRYELGIEEGTGFFLYTIEGEGILLKLIPLKELSEQSHIIKEIELNGDKLNIKKKNIEKSIESYKKNNSGKLQNI